jgi:hypothetical protein
MTRRQGGPSTAIFYGHHIPVVLFKQYQRVVLEAEATGSDEGLRAGKAELFPYVSIGEAEAWRPSYASLDKRWFLGRNEGWGADIVDLCAAGWRDYLLEERIAPLWARGYRNFFLDTLDSFRAAPLSEARLAAQEAGLRETLRALLQRFPKARVMFNRGFDLLPEFRPRVVGLVAESLYCGWDSRKKRYIRVADTDRTWLLRTLNAVQHRYRLPVTVVDYVPSEQRTEALHCAKNIAALGFVPWISSWRLDAVGVGAVDLARERPLCSWWNLVCSYRLSQS